jgi:hypothetical protein
MSPELAFELHTAQNVEMQKLARRQGLARSTASAGIRSHTIGQTRTLRLLRDCPDEKQPPDLKTPHRHRPYGLNPSIQTRPGRRGPYTTSWAHEVALTLG